MVLGWVLMSSVAVGGPHCKTRISEKINKIQIVNRHKPIKSLSGFGSCPEAIRRLFGGYSEAVGSCSEAIRMLFRACSEACSEFGWLTVPQHCSQVVCSDDVPQGALDAGSSECQDGVRKQPATEFFAFHRRTSTVSASAEERISNLLTF